MNLPLSVLFISTATISLSLCVYLFCASLNALHRTWGGYFSSFIHTEKCFVQAPPWIQGVWDLSKLIELERENRQEVRQTERDSHRSGFQSPTPALHGSLFLSLPARLQLELYSSYRNCSGSRIRKNSMNIGNEIQTLVSCHDIRVVHYCSLKSERPWERSLSTTNYNLAVKSFL